jgi:hypothetical protein
VREDARSLEPAGAADEGGRGPHVLVGGVVPGESQRDIGLDRRRGVTGAAEEVGPGPVGALLRADPVGRARRRGRIADAEELAHEEVLGVHRHVGFQLALPPAVAVLER